MPQTFGRPVRGDTRLPSFLDEAGRLRAFVPPFEFTSFFSPEDTLLCMCAAEAALSHARSPRSDFPGSAEAMRIAELTTGSGLVGLHLLMLEYGSKLTGLDIERLAVATATRNARHLGLSARSQFHQADLWSTETIDSLTELQPHLIVCNPPYVPEPATGDLEVEAGAGPFGTAHLIRTLEIAERLTPRSIALSWCSLADPAGIVRLARDAGYTLDSLFVVAIADGEYSGSVHSYLRSLPTAYINEDADTIRAVAPDGSGRFAYLLLAGNFSRREADSSEIADSVQGLCERFSSDGLSALQHARIAVPVRTWLLDRWDELRLRAYLHGTVRTAQLSA